MFSSNSVKICILGCGGFIGSHLTERILLSTSYQVVGVDLVQSKISHLLNNKRFTFIKMDVHDSVALQPYIEECETVISLVALCNPSLYNTVPLDVIESNFTNPLRLVKACSEMGKWLIHFSTCEVYGKTAAFTSGYLPGTEGPDFYLLNEDCSPMILGPVASQRWSYACAKQLLERVIFAYNFQHGLKYTLIRPFNFIGPRMDYIPGIDGEGIPRVLACFMDSLMSRKSIKLVDGGHSRRCFTYIEDAVDAVMAILDRPEQATSQVFNIGNPSNETTIADLAYLMIDLYNELERNTFKNFTVESVSSKDFYGEGYEDSDRRVPDISKATKLLGWAPQTGLEETLRRTIRAYLDFYSSQVELASEEVID